MMNRAERIYKLHGLLQERRPMSLRRLVGALEVSVATVKRDIAYMRDFMEAPIRYDPQANGYTYAEGATFELPGLWFNESELYGLLAVEGLLEAMQPGILAPYLGPLRGRIRKLLATSGHDPERVSQRIRLLAPGVRTVTGEAFTALAAAVLEGQRLRIDYESRSKGEATTRAVHPYRLLHYRHNWYLLAWCEQAQALRLFAADRVRGWQVLDGPLQPASDGDLDRYVEGAFGIFKGAIQGWAVLRFSPHMARWVADEHWHPEQIGYWRDGFYELQLPYADPTELLMEVLRYGPEVEVMAPPELRESVSDRLRATLAHYEG